MKRLFVLATFMVVLIAAFVGGAGADSLGPINFESPYTVGNIDGQQGWQKTGPYDVAVVNAASYPLITTYGFGAQALQSSDAVTSGSFGDQTFSPGLTNPAIDVGYRHFEASFSIGTALATPQVGLHMSVSPDNGQGARMSYLRFEEQGDGLVHVFFDDSSQSTPCSPAGCAAFSDTDIAQFAPGTVHSFKFVIDLVPGTASGAPNDVVKIYEDGTLIKTGTTWEGYYRYDPESGPLTVMPPISKLLFRESGTANTADAGDGFLIDNVSLSSAYEPVSGSWTLTAPSTTTYKAVVQQPINLDGSSSWPLKKGVIPVKFQLLSKTASIFESIGSDGFTGSQPDDSSALTFTPSSGTYFGDITNLAATYAFTTGNCHGGSLRWSIETPKGNVFVYYGAIPNFTDCTSTNQSGVNMTTTGDVRVDTSQVGGTFYDTWAHALSLVGDQPVSGIDLVLDGGWVTPNGDQVVTLSTASVNDQNWAWPAPADFAPTCNLPTAKIVVQKVGDATPIPTDETLSVSAADTTGLFRVADCMYLYNLSTSSLVGTGTYTVNVNINGANVLDPGIFGLR